MVSWTEHTRRKRVAKKIKSGKERKRTLRNKGSTPKFPVHPEGQDSEK